MPRRLRTDTYARHHKDKEHSKTLCYFCTLFAIFLEKIDDLNKLLVSLQRRAGQVLTDLFGVSSANLKGGKVTTSAASIAIINVF